MCVSLFITSAPVYTLQLQVTVSINQLVFGVSHVKGLTFHPHIPTPAPMPPFDSTVFIKVLSWSLSSFDTLLHSTVYNSADDVLPLLCRNQPRNASVLDASARAMCLCLCAAPLGSRPASARYASAGRIHWIHAAPFIPARASSHPLSKAPIIIE